GAGKSRALMQIFSEEIMEGLITFGIPIRTTFDNSTTVQYAGLLQQLTMKARSTVRDIDPRNDLTFLRIRSKKHEIMVAPENEYLLIVIQKPCE
uniref:Dynein light chain roadblock-type 2 n=1 Tax=Apteryx owenii TaxID=8824 RepID=A0A8B9PLQ6_APTOW